jgi:hypothetical protein
MAQGILSTAKVDLSIVPGKGTTKILNSTFLAKDQAWVMGHKRSRKRRYENHSTEFKVRTSVAHMSFGVGSMHA